MDDRSIIRALTIYVDPLQTPTFRRIEARLSSEPLTERISGFFTPILLAYMPVITYDGPRQIVLCPEGFISSLELLFSIQDRPHFPPEFLTYKIPDTNQNLWLSCFPYLLLGDEMYRLAHTVAVGLTRAIKGYLGDTGRIDFLQDHLQNIAEASQRKYQLASTIHTYELRRQKFILSRDARSNAEISNLRYSVATFMRDADAHVSGRDNHPYFKPVITLGVKDKSARLKCMATFLALADKFAESSKGWPNGIMSAVLPNYSQRYLNWLDETIIACVSGKNWPKLDPAVFEIGKYTTADLQRAESYFPLFRFKNR